MDLGAPVIEWNPGADASPSEDIQALADYQSPASVIDVGCGTGRNLVPFDRAGVHLHGIDSNPAAVAVARERFRAHKSQSVAIALADVREYHLDRRFDVLICHGVLHFLTRAERLAVYEKFKLWVTDGGTISLVMFNTVVPIPDDLAPLMPEPAVNSSEILEAFSDRRILRHRAYIFEDTHDHGAIRHTHSIDRLLVENTREVNDGNDNSSVAPGATT